jgi:hypothetical protein
MQNDRHGQLLFIAEVSLEEGFDRLRLPMHQTHFIKRLGLVQRDQLDDPVGLAREIIQHHIKVFVVLLKNLQPRIKARIRLGKLGEIDPVSMPK